MNKIVVIFILSCISSFCLAQQQIMFNKIIDPTYYPVTKQYTLPQSVTCFFKDGSKKRMMLEHVNGDTLFFIKFYNQTGNACLYSSLRKMKIHKKGEVFLGVLCAGFSGTAIFFVTIAIMSNHPPTDAGDPSLAISHLAAIASTIPITGAIITAAALPKHYDPQKWKLYAK